MANSISVDQVLSQIRAIRQEASTQVGAFNEAGKSADKVDFSAMLKQSVDAVNATQQHAGSMAAAFERGDANVNLTEVMVSLQKADVSFKTMVEVRNKLVDAYQEIMRMSV